MLFTHESNEKIWKTAQIQSQSRWPRTCFWGQKREGGFSGLWLQGNVTTCRINIEFTGSVYISYFGTALMWLIQSEFRVIIVSCLFVKLGLLWSHKYYSFMIIWSFDLHHQVLICLIFFIWFSKKIGIAVQNQFLNRYSFLVFQYLFIYF